MATSHVAKPIKISDLFQVPERFVRSVQLERDFHDLNALQDYILTPAMVEAFRRVLEGIGSGSGRRAWRVTGDYGVGKSSFALVLAHLVSGRTNPALSRISESLGWCPTVEGAPPLWPILLTGSRVPIISSIAGAIAGAVERKRPARGRVPRAHTALIEFAREVEASGNLEDLEKLIQAVRDQAASEGAGLLLIVDELGKFLEFAAQRTDQTDVFVLQRLAELAARSDDQPFLFLGLLHQGFHAYAERLPSIARSEWEKVAGRFEEIVFDQPLAHTAALVSGALQVDVARLGAAMRDAAAMTSRATAEMGWLGGQTTGAAGLDVARLYPLHPTLLPVLVRFFARFGQHERSLFGFLLSSEPFGLQSFAAQSASPDAWYRLENFYDYVRACFGHRLAGASYRSQWLRIVGTVDAATDISNVELGLLKSVAILNLLDADDLAPTERALIAASTPQRRNLIESALLALVDRGTLFRRGMNAGLRLWPNSSVNLEGALEQAQRAVDPITAVAQGLIPFLNGEPIVARRHYLEGGTLRYFEVRHCVLSTLQSLLEKPIQGDGLVAVVIADDEGERAAAITFAQDAVCASRSDLVLCIAATVSGLAPELADLKHWLWIRENIVELAEDRFGAAEVARQVEAARRNLLAGAARAGVDLKAPGGLTLFWQGEEVSSDRAPRGLTSLLSAICDESYRLAPRITNELLNRNQLSSAAAAARMRLIERIFTSAHLVQLGMDPDKAPPERSMYLSVLKEGGVHVDGSRGYELVLPDPEADRLKLGPSLRKIAEIIERRRGDRVPLPEILSELRKPPYGVRDGVAPLLLAIILRIRAHELAVYENGTFLHRFGPSDFLRLVKAPATFDIQHCLVTGVRLDIFNALLRSFGGAEDVSKAPDLLEVVRPLCTFAAQLPEYTRRTSGLSAEATAVRGVLTSSREPVTMLFQELPRACGLAPFAPGEEQDHDHVRMFADRLQERIEELRGAYASLLGRIVDRTSIALGDEPGRFDRVRLAARASRVSLVARDPRLRTFALRLRDPGLADTAWAEALASYLVSKPPAKWIGSDEARFGEEAGVLAEHFRKTEAAAFLDPEAPPEVAAVRVNLTRGDGTDLVSIVEPRERGEELDADLERFRGKLPQDRRLRLQFLAELLWSELEVDGSDKASEASGDPDRKLIS